MSNMNNMKPQTHRHQPDNMTLRNGKDVYPKYDPFEFMILRSGRGVLLYNIGHLAPLTKEAIINPPFKLDDGTPRRLVPDKVQSSNRFGHNDLADFTQPNILRDAMRTPVDAERWSRLSCDDRRRLTLQGRAPIKEEME